MHRESLHGSEPLNAHVESVRVVVSQEIGERAGPDDGRAVRPGIRPFSQAGTDKPFGLAVCLGAIGTGPVMPQREPVTECTKAPSAVGAAVIGQEGADHHAAAGKPAVGQRQEGGRTSRSFIRQEGGIRQTRPIVDGDVEKFQATPPAPATVIAVNPMAHASKAAQLFDIQVHQLARAGTLVAADRGRGRTWTPCKTEPPLDMDDGGERHMQIPGNPE
jgi:hypothetical protein